jgi:hypothetical protein
MLDHTGQACWARVCEDVTSQLRCIHPARLGQAGVHALLGWQVVTTQVIQVQFSVREIL